MGTLRIRGSIDLAQFWPQGESDADTTKIKLTVDQDSFEFAKDDVHFKPTSVYDKAVVRGTTRKAVITKGKVTIRLQGIDAPELHYRAGALPRKGSSVTDAQRQKFNQLNAPQRRQYFGEAATVALAAYLKPFAIDGVLACEAVSTLDTPDELLDTYGRAVANIRVGTAFKEDINVWLARQGWAFPTFYTSMKPAEIQLFLDAMQAGQKKPRVWRHLSGDASKFDANLVFRRAPAQLEADQDKGPVLMPKIFRRQVAYRMHRAAGLVKGNFEKYLAQQVDECVLLKEFLAQGIHSAPTHELNEFVSGYTFTKQPHELVFKEKPSTLLDEHGKKITSF